MKEFSRSRCSRNVRNTRGMQTDNRYDLLVVAPEKFPLDDGIFLEAQASLSLLLKLRITEVRQVVGLSSARRLNEFFLASLLVACSGI